jgi:NADH:ubiquinone oxidoreductase subunit E
VCIGSSCHLKGSRQIVEEFQTLIAENNLKDKVELSGAFCMSNCQNGVSITLNDTLFSLKPESARDFFRKEVLTKISVQ